MKFQQGLDKPQCILGWLQRHINGHDYIFRKNLRKPSSFASGWYWGLVRVEVKIKGRGINCLAEYWRHECQESPVGKEFFPTNAAGTIWFSHTKQTNKHEFGFLSHTIYKH